MPEVNQDRLNQLLGQMLNDLGGAASVAMVRMGDALGLYKILKRDGPMTSAILASAAGVHERYTREWLAHQVASNYLAYHSATQRRCAEKQSNRRQSPTTAPRHGKRDNTKRPS